MRDVRAHDVHLSEEEEVRALPWALLGLLILHRWTWGQCQCDDLQRRVTAAQRELASYREENFLMIKHMEEVHGELVLERA